MHAWRSDLSGDKLVWRSGISKCFAVLLISLCIWYLTGDPSRTPAICQTLGINLLVAAAPGRRRHGLTTKPIPAFHRALTYSLRPH